MIVIDWEAKRLSAQHRSPENGSVVNGLDGTKQQIEIDLRTCQMI